MISNPKQLEPLKLNLQGSNLIEASAGTGKTFTIAILYIRLILGDKKLSRADLDPTKILVVTFTEAATKELRDRIRKRLSEAATVFGAVDDKSNDKDTEILYKLREEYHENEWGTCRQKLLQAIDLMDEAAISTIHGWCYRMLNEHSFDSGNLFNLNLITDDADLYELVSRDYWRTFVYPLMHDETSIMTSFWKSPDELLKKVDGLIKQRDKFSQEDPQASLASLITEAKLAKKSKLEELKSYPWAEWANEVPELLQTIAKKHVWKKAQLKKVTDIWPELVDWSQSEDDFPIGLGKAGFNNHLRDGFRSNLTVDADSADLSHPAFDAIEKIVGISNNLPSPQIDILKHAAHWIANRMDSERQKRSEMGVNDLITKLKVALDKSSDGRLAALIRKQFPAALIDEFQDTDPLQFSIFNKIYDIENNDPETCFLMIGDPKQAIYGFRGADIFTYLKARSLTSDRRHTLSKNYRSDKGMVDAVNHLFAKADKERPRGAFLFGQGESSELPFQKVDANGRQENLIINGNSESALSFLVLDAEDDGSGKVKALPKGKTQKHVAEIFAAKISQMLKQGLDRTTGFNHQERGKTDQLEPLLPKDIAVLVNTGTEAAAIRSALNKLNIKSVYLSDRDSVLATDEAKELLIWLKAFAEPQTLSNLRAALASPSLGRTILDAEKLLVDEIELEKRIEQFIAYHELWQKQGILPAIRRFLSDFDVPSRLFSDHDGERRLTNLLHLAEILQADSFGLDGSVALINHYQEILKESEQQNDHRTVRLESDDDLLKVVTVHKSKGLEYPVVFLPFATYVREEEGKSGYVCIHDDNKEMVVCFNPEQQETEEAEKERRGEDIRKLYVALTRARYATIVGAAATDKWGISGLGCLLGESKSVKDALNELVNDADSQLISVQRMPDIEGIPYQSDSMVQLGKAKEPQRGLSDNWWIASYSRITYENGHHTLTAEPEFYTPDIDRQVDERDDSTQSFETEHTPQSGTVHAFPKGADVGNMLHNLMEWACNEGFADSLNKRDELLELATSYCKRHGWDDGVELVVKWIRDLINVTFDLPEGGETSLFKAQKSKAEMEFFFGSNNVSVTQMDALVCRQTLDGIERPQAEKMMINGMLKGFIDLIFEHQGKFYVLDYKSNYIGVDDSAYTYENMRSAILKKRYDLQYVLYTLALHRYLRYRLADYDYDQCIGGVVYMFLRGVNSDTAGAFTDRPSRELIERLDSMFDGQDQESAA